MPRSRRSRRAWGGYDPTAGVRAIMDFVVDDLSNWYVRAQPVRGSGRPTRPADPAAVATLHEALATVAGCWRRRRRSPATGSTAPWREPRCISPGFRSRSAGGDPTLEGAMDAVRRLASLAHARPATGADRRAPAAGPDAGGGARGGARGRRSTSCWSCSGRR